MEVHNVWIIGKDGFENLVEGLKESAKKHFNLDEENPEIVIAIGGEGTIFRAVKEYPNSAVLPLRKSSFAALSQLNLSDALLALKKIKSGKFMIEKVGRVEVEYKNFKAWGINDIVIHRDDENANRFRVFLNKKDVYKDEIMGDGIIVSTPYGSTGYNWTAGGPVLKRDENKLTITPICSAYFNKRFKIKNRIVMKKVESKVFPNSKEIVIKFFRNIRNKIVLDGRQEERLFVNIRNGDEIKIRKAKALSKLLRI